MKDYYKILGVPRTASKAEIKRAYRRLMKGCHPDVNSSPKAADWARQLNDACDVLSDSAARMSYDLKLKPAEGDASARRGSDAGIQEQTFWQRLHRFELHPLYYHAGFVACVTLLLVLGIRALNAASTADASSREWQAFSPPSRALELPYASESWAAAKIDRGAFYEPEQLPPQQGALTFSHDFANYHGTTPPLTVKTRASDGNCVMKVVDWETGQFVAAWFIRRGKTLSAELPPGAYKLKFASGDKWYGPKFLFGPQTSYSFIPYQMTLSAFGNNSVGHEIDLNPKLNGNLDALRMRPEDW